MNRKLRIALGITALIINQTIQARLLLEESFAYADAVLTDVSAACWQHHGGQSNEIEVASGSIYLTGNETEDVHVLFPEGPMAASSTETLYARLSLTVTELPTGANGGYFAHFKDTATGYRCRLFITTNEAAAGSYRLGLSCAASAPSVLYPHDLILHQVYMVLMSYRLRDGFSCLWLDPADEPAAFVAAADTGSLITAAGFAFRQSSGIGNLSVTELALATALDDLVVSGTNEAGLPRIVIPPQTQTAMLGSDVVFSATVEGQAPLFYQWQHDGVDLAGATNSTLVLIQVTPQHAGGYRVIATNILGVAYSPPAQLSIIESDSPEFEIAYTNRLDPQIRAGDPSTNEFTELTLLPGEAWTLDVRVTGPAHLAWDLQPRSDLLPSAAIWTQSVLSDSSVASQFHFEPGSADAGAHYYLTIEAVEGQNVTNWSWTVYVPTVAEQQIIINEFLANPTTDTLGSHFNPLARATIPSNLAVADEYVEIVNLGPGAVSLAGWSLSDQTKVRHYFSTGCQLAGGDCVVAYGGPFDAALPNINARTEAASEGPAGLALNNSGTETLVLRNADGRLVARVVYTEKMLSGSGSLTRHPDFTSAFIPHDQVSALTVSPGYHHSGADFHTVCAVPWLPTQLKIQRSPQGDIHLTWTANNSDTFSVWRTDCVQDAWEQLTDNLNFPDGAGMFTDTNNLYHSKRFYRISSP